MAYTFVYVIFFSYLCTLKYAKTKMIEENNITVTSPLLPKLEDLNELLRDIWSRKWITNMGHYHQELENALGKYLRVEHISLFTNGTLPLITALQALDIREGEVITSPYSFVATSHAIWWNHLTPVFIDVDPNTGNIDPSKIEAAITDKTVAILPVHCYGCPCDVERIDAIAKKHHLKVIYDAAHTFGVKVQTRREGAVSILDFGDISTISFHATKVYNTIEGGALVCHSAEMKRLIDQLKNFGFEDETIVLAPGINSKMDEVRSAYGLLNLQQVDDSIAARKRVARQYTEAIKGVKGIDLFPYIESLGAEQGFEWNCAYYPILINEAEYGMSRDALYEKLKANNILGRRYFYPLITTFEPYREFPTANPSNLPVATDLANRVICLPMHHAITNEDIARVINAIGN